MIRHTVLLRFEPALGDDEYAAMAAALDALPAAIPQLVTYRHGRDLALAPTNYDYAISADVASVDDFAVYRDHAEHQRFITEHITGRVADRIAVQFEY